MEEHRGIQIACLIARDEREIHSYMDRSGRTCCCGCSVGLISAVRPECSMRLGGRYELSCLRGTLVTY